MPETFGWWCTPIKTAKVIRKNCYGYPKNACLTVIQVWLIQDDRQLKIFRCCPQRICAHFLTCYQNLFHGDVIQCWNVNFHLETDPPCTLVDFYMPVVHKLLIIESLLSSLE